MQVVEVIHSGLAGKPLRLLERNRENLPSLSIYILFLLFSLTLIAIFS